MNDKGSWRARWLVLAAALCLALMPAGVSAESDEKVEALLGDKAIDARLIPTLHCHDRDFPAINCFETEDERDADLESGMSALSSALYYVTWYEHSNYGGLSFTAANYYPDLRTIYWDNLISSFKSLNSQRPKWWDGYSYSGTSWQWLAGAQISYVGDGANDRFSSVKNVP
jgi:hypothetical protein